MRASRALWRGSQILERVRGQPPERIAVIDSGVSGAPPVTYGSLASSAAALAPQLIAAAAGPGGGSLQGARVAFCTAHHSSYVRTLLGIWHAGGVCVPLHQTQDAESIEHAVALTETSILAATPEMAPRLQPLAAQMNLPLVEISEGLSAEPSSITDLAVPSEIDGGSDAVIVFTSGTTGRPKGVRLTHDNLSATCTSLEEAWGWTGHDRILHILPLHHNHGLINKLCCPLWVGASTELLDAWSPESVWAAFLREPDAEDALTVFMATPTIYAKLYEHYQSTISKTIDMEEAPHYPRNKTVPLPWCVAVALPPPFFLSWADLTGHRLLERYGMNEIGMGLTNPLVENEQIKSLRRPGYVGLELPGLESRLVPLEDEGVDYPRVVDKMLEKPGCFQVRGPTVFAGYYNRPEATAEAFTADGWFRTGDTVVYDSEANSYRHLGRSSVDIMQPPKLSTSVRNKDAEMLGMHEPFSAFAVEAALLTHPLVQEATVLSTPPLKEVGAVVAVRGGIASLPRSNCIVEDLREHLSEQLGLQACEEGGHQPRRWRLVDSIPRNVMGKVNKKALSADLFGPTIGVVCAGNLVRSQVFAHYLSKSLQANAREHQADCVWRPTMVFSCGTAAESEYIDADDRLTEVKDTLISRGESPSAIANFTRTIWSEAETHVLLDASLILTADTARKEIVVNRLSEIQDDIGTQSLRPLRERVFTFYEYEPHSPGKGVSFVANHCLRVASGSQEKLH